jgi:hypothetical protein
MENDHLKGQEAGYIRIRAEIACKALFSTRENALPDTYDIDGNLETEDELICTMY